MKKMMTRMTIACLIACASTSYAKTCQSDQNEMLNAIQQSGSISTTACPYNQRGFGISDVVNAKSHKKTCSATCHYADSSGASNCEWQLGNWGDTLACH